LTGYSNNVLVVVKELEKNKVVKNFLNGVGSLKEVGKLVGRWQHLVFLFYFLFSGRLNFVFKLMVRPKVLFMIEVVFVTCYLKMR